MSENILGFNLYDGDLNKWIMDITNNHLISEHSSALFFVQLNPHSYEVSMRDKSFYDAIMNANYVFPDGIGIVLASRILGGKIYKRISGYDIFIGLSTYLNSLNDKRFSYFFLGSNVTTLNKITMKLSSEFPNIVVVGTYSPPFKETFDIYDIQKMIEAVNKGRPDVLWIGLTAPKQEKLAFQNRNKFDVKLIAPIGAVFDYYAGNIAIAPEWIRKCGFEWLFRFVQEPRRLFYRNFVSNPKFLFRVLSYKVKSIIS